MFTATEEQIKEWKSKFPAVFSLTSKEAEKRAYVRNPSRQEFSYLSTIKDPMKFNEAVLKTCWLDGDMEVQTDDTIFMGLSEKIVEIFAFKEVELEKL